MSDWFSHIRQHTARTMGRTIGSSDVPKILGLSPWGSVWEVWARLHGLTGYDAAGSPATRRGNMLEASLVGRYADELGVHVTMGPGLDEPGVQGPEPWMHARPDAYAGHRRPDVGVTPGPARPDWWNVEAKTSRYLDPEDGWGDPGTDQVPAYYRAQVAWQNLCTGAPRTDLVAFGTVQDDFRVYVLEAHLELQAVIRQRVTAWHHRHVVSGEPPPVEAGPECREVLQLCWPAPTTGKRPDAVATVHQLQAVQELRAVRDTIDALTARKKLLEAHLVASIGPAGRLVDASGTKLAGYGDRKGRTTIDTEELARRYPELAAELTRTSPAGRSFRLNRKDT